MIYMSKYDFLIIEYIGGINDLYSTQSYFN